MDPVVGNLLSILLQNSETKDYAEELTNNLAELNNINEVYKKKGIIEKVFEIANKITIVSQTSEAIKPIASGLFEALKLFAISEGIPLSNYFC